MEKHNLQKIILNLIRVGVRNFNNEIDGWTRDVINEDILYLHQDKFTEDDKLQPLANFIINIFDGNISPEILADCLCCEKRQALRLIDNYNNRNQIELFIKDNHIYLSDEDSPYLEEIDED